MFAPKFESFVRPARARPEIWRLVLGVMLAFATYLLGTLAVIAFLWIVLSPEAELMVWAAGIGAPATPFQTYIVLFGSFSMMALGVVAAARFLHRRGPKTLFGRAPVVLRHFFIGASITLGLSTLVYIPALLVGFDGIPNLDPSLWLILLPLTLLGVLIQTGAEELAFRGYLQQQMAARFRSPIAWMLIPSVLFGAVHYNPALGPNVWFPVAVATLFGLVAADLTARTGSIGAAWGVHFANNLNGIAIVSTQGTVNGLSLFLTPYRADDPDLLGWSVLPSICLLAAAWYLTRRLCAR